MVQIAELETVAETIEATLNYFVDTGTRPVTMVGAPGGSDVRSGGGGADPHRVVLRNGRPYADSFALERDGFRFVRHDTEVRDFYDEEEIRRVYYPEMEALVKAESGARRVVVFDHTLRTPDQDLREAAKIREVVRRVHNDYTEWSAPKRVRDLLPDEADELLQRRFAIVQVWRPIRHPVGVLASGDRRRAKPLTRGHGGDRAPLSGPHRADLRDHLQPVAPLVLVSADAPRRGAGLQGLRLDEGRPRPVHRPHRLRRPDHPAARPAAREHRNPHSRFFLIMPVAHYCRPVGLQPTDLIRGEGRDPWHRCSEPLEQSHFTANTHMVVRRNDGPRLPPGSQEIVGREVL